MSSFFSTCPRAFVSSSSRLDRGFLSMVHRRPPWAAPLKRASCTRASPFPLRDRRDPTLVREAFLFGKHCTRTFSCQMLGVCNGLDFEPGFNFRTPWVYLWNISSLLKNARLLRTVMYQHMFATAACNRIAARCLNKRRRGSPPCIEHDHSSEHLSLHSSFLCLIRYAGYSPIL